VNGNDSIPNRYPYQVTMVDDRGEFYCGGTLIASDIVLTAAHCDVPEWVWVGRHYRENDNDDSDRHDVLFSYRHPRYVEDTLEFDMKLLKLRTPTDRLPILLNNNPDLPNLIRGNDQNIVTAVGFGKTQDGPKNVLQEADVSAISNQDCRQAKDPSSFNIDYRNGYNEKIFEDMLCLTDIANRGSDSCTGDSGGPAILKGNTAEEDVQVGVISWAFGCGLSNFPGVYSRISYEYTWLESSTCVMSDQQQLKNFECDGYFVTGTNDAGNGQMTELVITIRFGLYPERISWAFTDATTYETLAYKPSSEYASLPAGAYSREVILLPAGSNITYTIWSLGTNGLQTFSATFEDLDGNEITMLSGYAGCNARQDSVSSAPFVLPIISTSQPTLAPTTEAIPTEAPTTIIQTSQSPTTMLSSEPTSRPSENNTTSNTSPTVFTEDGSIPQSFVQYLNLTDRNETESFVPTASPSTTPSSPSPSSFPTDIQPLSASSSVAPSNSPTLMPTATLASPPNSSRGQIDLVFVEVDLESASATGEKHHATSNFQQIPASSAPHEQGVPIYGSLVLIVLLTWSITMTTMDIIFG